MSGLNNDVTLDVIIERCMVAIDERRRLQDANQPTNKILGLVPPWFGVLSAIVIVLIGFGTLRSDVATAKDQSNANRDAIAAMAPRLSSIETNVSWLVEERKREK